MRVDYRGSRRGVVTVVLLSVIGCTEASPPSLEVAARDSSGIQIVENPSSIETRVPVSTLTDVPELMIGAVDGAPEYQFGSVRGAVTRADGSIAVLDVMSREVRLYDSAGVFLRSVGGVGSGPGEFQLPTYLGRISGDTLSVFDLRAQRLSVFDEDLELVRTIALRQLLTEPTGFLTPDVLVGVSPTESWLPGEAVGEVVNRYVIHRIDLSTGRSDTIALVGDERMYITAMQSTPVPFTTRPSVATAGGNLFVADGYRPDVQVYGADGQLHRIVRLGRDSDRVTAEAFQQVVEVLIEGEEDPDVRREMRRVYDAMSVPDRRPLFSGMFTRGDQEVWVREFDPSSDGISRWTVLNIEGEVIAVAELPTNVELFGGDAHTLVGVQRSHLGVQYVTQWRLVP